MERTFLNQQGVEVTNLRLIVHGQTYVTSHISSVRTVFNEGKKDSSIILFIFAIVNFGIDYLLLGAFLVFLSIFFWFKNKDCFYLAISTSGREFFVLKSEDSKFISYVANALNEALVYKPE